MNDIIEHCQYLLSSHHLAQLAQEYLNSRISKSSQTKFQFGYFPSSQDIQLISSVISEETLLENNLLFKKQINDSLSSRTIYQSYFDQHSLILPFKDAYGNVVAIVGRTLLSEEERIKLKFVKYKNTTPFQKSNHLFGLFEAKQSILNNNCVYVVEGQFDAIRAQEAGLENTVALGTSHMSPVQLALLLRYTDNINLVLDNDQAGEKGRAMIQQKYAAHANFKDCFVPKPHKDIAEFLDEYKIEDLGWTS